MEVESNVAPSLPENYLTLAQLQDRWLKEQERKQVEKLNQERELQQQLEREEKAEREGKQREEDDAKKRRTTKEVAVKTSTHLRDRRDQHRQKANEPRIEADVVDDVAGVTDESRQQQQKKKKKKKSSNWKKRNESRVAKMGAGETADVLTAGETAEVQLEEVEKVVVEITQEVERAKSKIQINGNGSDGKGKRWVEKDKVLGDETAHSIVQKFEGLSVNGGKEGNMRPRGGRNGRNGGYRRGSGRVDVHSKRPQGRRDDNYVWVKKGDSTDASVNGVQC